MFYFILFFCINSDLLSPVGASPITHTWGREAERHPFRRSASDGGDARCKRAGGCPGLHNFLLIEQAWPPGLLIASPVGLLMTMLRGWWLLSML